MRKSGPAVSPERARAPAAVFGGVGILLWGVSVLVVGRYLSLPMVVHSDFANFYYADAAYPPLVRLLLLPFTWLPPYPAYLLWSALTIGAYLLLLVWLKRTLDLHFTVPWLCLVSGLAVGWYPLWAHLALGQISVFLTLCVLGGWLALRRGHEWGCGIAWGLACALKLFPGLLLIYLLLRQRWRGAGAMALTAAAGFLLPLLALPDLSLPYLMEVISSNATLYTLYPVNVSLHGVFSRLLLDNPWFQPLAEAPTLALALWGLASLGVGAVWAWQVWHLPRTDCADSFALAYTCIAMILLSPLSWQHSFPLLLLPFGLLLRALLERPEEGLRRAILLTWVCFALPDLELARALMRAYAPYRPPWWSGLPLLLPTVGMFCLWGLLAWTWREHGYAGRNG